MLILADTQQEVNVRGFYLLLYRIELRTLWYSHLEQYNSNVATGILSGQENSIWPTILMIVFVVP